MARLSAGYRHFWANGKIYQRFWANTSDPGGNASGATLTVNGSVLSGVVSSGASVAGVTFTVGASLINGAVAVSYANPSELLTVLASIAGGAAGASGATITATGSVLAGAVSAGAGLAGVTSTVGTSLIDGAISVSYAKQAELFTVAASLVGGAASVNVDISGALFNVPLTLFEGTGGRIDVTAPLNTRLNARYRHFWGRKRSERHFWAQWEGSGIGPSLANGDLVVASLAGFIVGDVHADANLAGVTLTVAATLLPGDDQVIEPGEPALTVMLGLIGGTATADANLAGTTYTINASLVQGFARFDTITVTTALVSGVVFVPPDALAIPAPLNAINVTLFAGAPVSGAAVIGADVAVNVQLIAGEVTVTSEGAVLPVGVSLIDGQSSGDGVINDQALVIVGVSIEPGIAEGEINETAPKSGRVAGPVSYRKVTPGQEAQAFGATVGAGAGIVGGKATGEKNLTEWVLPEAVPLAPEPASPVAPSLTVLPEEARQEAEARGNVASASTSIEGGRVTIDWTDYDNMILELL